MTVKLTRINRKEKNQCYPPGKSFWPAFKKPEIKTNFKKFERSLERKSMI